MTPDESETFTFNDYLTTWSRHQEPSQRSGQWAFNLLQETRPDLSNKVCGDALNDPFYDDRKLPNFLAWVAVRWDDA